MTRDIDSSDISAALSRFDCDDNRVMVAYSRSYVTQTGHMYCLGPFISLFSSFGSYCRTFIIGSSIGG